MSLTTPGVWGIGVWNPSVWADGVWFEGTQPVIIEEGVKPSGGYRPFEERDPYRFIPQITRIIKETAQLQFENPHFDEPQILEHLIAELELKNIEFQAVHLEALNAYREVLIENEIKTLFKQKDENEAMLLILIAANLT